MKTMIPLPRLACASARSTLRAHWQVIRVLPTMARKAPPIWRKKFDQTLNGLARTTRPGTQFPAFFCCL